MNNYLNLILVFVFVLFVNGQTPSKNIKTDLTQKNLKGKVKSVYDSICNISKGQDSDFNVHEYYFNESGFLIQSHYLSKGLRVKTSEYKYDKEGKLLEVDFMDHNLNNSTTFIAHDFYIYNEIGQNIEHIQYDEENKLKKHEFYKYDFSGKRIEEFMIDPYYEPFDSNKIINKYDLSRNLIEKLWYNKKGMLEVKYSYTFNKLGNQIEELSTDGNGQVAYHWIGTYDDKHNCTEKIHYHADGRINLIEEYFYEGFDNDGNWTKSIRYMTEFAEDDIDQHPYDFKLKTLKNFNIRKIEYY